MADSSVIKEFLVALGFKIDDSGAKNFENGIKKATQAVGSLITALEALATAVGAAVTKVSSQFEDLYFASQRLGSSVENIKAYGFALSQVGGSAQGARQAAEAVAEFVRSIPQGAGWIEKNLGVPTKDASGNLRQMTDIMTDIGHAFQGMDYSRAKPLAAVLGIGPDQLQAMMRGSDEFEDRYHQLAKNAGVDLDKLAKSSHDFMNDFRDMLAMIELRLAGLVQTIQPFADWLVKALEALDQATHGWSTALLTLVGVLGPVAAILGPLLMALDPIVWIVVGAAAAIGALSAAIGGLIADFDAWKSGSQSFINWGEWSDEIDGVLDACKSIGASFDDLLKALKPVGDLISKLGGLLGSVFGAALKAQIHAFLASITDNLRLVGDAIKVVTDLIHGDWKGAGRDAAQYGKDLLASQTDPAKAAAKSMAESASGKAPASTGASAKAHAAGVKAQARAASASASAPGATSTQAHMLQFFMGQGMSAEQAKGVVAGIWAESKGDIHAFNGQGGGDGAFGIGQWRGARLAELRKRYGANPNLDQQLEFLNWELHGGDKGGASVMRSGDAQSAMFAYLANVMRPGGGLGGDLKRGAAYLSSLNGTRLYGGANPGVAMSQQTTINVNGAQDPRASAVAVSGAQDRVNADMLRQLKVAVS